MDTKERVMYMVLGCLLTLAGYILARMNNDSIAQSGAEDVTFGTITPRFFGVDVPLMNESRKGYDR